MEIQELTKEINDLLTEKIYIYVPDENEPLGEEYDECCVVMLNNEESHNKGLLTYQYFEEHYELADLLGLSEAMESVFEVEMLRDDFVCKLEELVKRCPNLILTTAPF